MTHDITNYKRNNDLKSTIICNHTLRALFCVTAQWYQQDMTWLLWLKHTNTLHPHKHLGDTYVCTYTNLCSVHGTNNRQGA